MQGEMWRTCGKRAPLEEVSSTACLEEGSVHPPLDVLVLFLQ